MLLRPRVLGLLLGAAIAASALPAAAAPKTARPTGAWPAWRAPFGDVMRDTRLVRGEWVHTNTLWLANGANADGLEREDYFAANAPDDPGRMTGDVRRALTYEFFGMGRSVTNGDHELPTDTKRWPDGTGEVAELRMQTDADELFIRVRWHSYPSPTSQLATLAFATPRSQGSQAPLRPWPGISAPLPAVMLSYDVAVTISGRGTSAVVSAEPGARALRVASRDASHVTEVRLPLSMLPRGPWALSGGSGLARPTDPTQYWLAQPGPASADRPGSGGPSPQPSLLGLLFARENPWQFDERRQAELLRAGSTGDASYVLDPRDLMRKRTLVRAPRAGDVTRIYASRHDFGDGITRTPGVAGTMGPPNAAPVGKDLDVTYTRTGRLQDYAMRVPAAYDGRRAWPLIVYLHGFGGTPEEPFRLPLGLVDEAEKRGYLFASLQGRGDTFYRPGLGELDVMEALADVRKHYRVDADRIYLMGHSMGGYGTNNIATRHPELFAAVAPMQGTDSIDLAGNLAHVPWLMVTSDQDLDAGGAQANTMYDVLSQRGYDATLVHYRMKTHEYSSIYDSLPRIFDHFDAHLRVRDPSFVSWTRPSTTDDRPALGQVPDGAYWVDEVGSGTVTAVSSAIRPRGGSPGPTSEDVLVADEGGPSRRTIARIRTTRPGRPGPWRAQNKLSLLLSGGSRLSIDLRKARLVADGLHIYSYSDESYHLTLRGMQDGRYRVVFDYGKFSPETRRLDVRGGTGVLEMPGVTAGDFQDANVTLIAES